MNIRKTLKKLKKKIKRKTKRLLKKETTPLPKKTSIEMIDEAIESRKDITYTSEKIADRFSDVEPRSKVFLYTYENPSFIFRDESWEHIQTFLKKGKNKIYCWDQMHSSDLKRLKEENNTIQIISPRKNNNWNCLFYRKFSRGDFELSFRFQTETINDEIQISFNCIDLCKRCRFMIRNGEIAVFEVVENRKFHRYLRQKPFHVELGREYSVRVIKLGNTYGFYIDGECLFFVEDHSKLNFGGDIAIILYNRDDSIGINASVSDITIRTDRIPKTKVGILTYHRVQNYGAFLQAYSLYKRLSEISSFDCEIIDYRTMQEEKWYESIATKPRANGQDFYHKQFEMFNHIADSDVWRKSEDGVVSDSIRHFNSYVDGKYDIIICGSDEIWRVNSCRGFPTAYWLWGNLHARKVACAVSLGDGLSVLSEDEKDRVRENLKGFSLVTCREASGCDELSELMDKSAEILCDPTFTYNPPMQFSGLLEQKMDLSNGKKNVLVMLDIKNRSKIANKIQTDLGEKYNLLSMFRYNNDFININVESPFEWAEIIKEVDFVITSLFHGTIFSILSGTPFISLCTNTKRRKILSLADGNPEIEARLVTADFEEVDFANLIEQPFEFDSRNYILQNKEAFEKFVEKLKQIDD